MVPLGSHLETQSANQPSNVASELTLLMLFPLLESQAKSDPSLRSQITTLLTQFFKSSPPLSIKGPKTQLDKIENLLLQWVKKDENNEIMTCLITLGCARDSVETLIKITKVIMESGKNLNCDLSEMLDKVLSIDYEDQQPKILDVHYHQCGFHYNAK